MSTLFTKIIAGDIPARFVWADDVAVAFGTIAPITEGHMLVVPRAEIVQLTEAPDDVLAHLVLVAKTIGQAQQQAWSAPRAALLVAGFEVDAPAPARPARLGRGEPVVPQRPHRRPRGRAGRGGRTGPGRPARPGPRRPRPGDAGQPRPLTPARPHVRASCDRMRGRPVGRLQRPHVRASWRPNVRTSCIHLVTSEEVRGIAAGCSDVVVSDTQGRRAGWVTTSAVRQGRVGADRSSRRARSRWQDVGTPGSPRSRDSPRAP